MKARYKVPLGNIVVSKEATRLVNEVLKSSNITEGYYTNLFEKEFAKKIKTKYCVSVTSGTAGLMVALQSLFYLRDSIGSVVVPALTFPATLNSTILTGYDAILSDVSYDMLMSGDNLNQAISNHNIGLKSDYLTNNFVGTIPVHLFGYAADMYSINKVAKKNNMFVLEDCCEAVGSKYKGKYVGAMGDLGVFSFYASHPLGIGEYGCIVTNNKKLYRLLKTIKNHGRVGSNLAFNHKYIGFNFKVTELMSAIAYTKVQEMDLIIKKRQEIVKTIIKNVNNQSLILGKYDKNCSYLGFPIGAYKNINYVTRKLNSLGIETRKCFPCLKNISAYKDMFSSFNYDNAEYFARNYFYIGCYETLTQEQINFIIKALNSV